jgi:hypothetical protein
MKGARLAQSEELIRPLRADTQRPKGVRTRGRGGEICCSCKNRLPPLGPTEMPRERYCSQCAPSQTRRVYMSFMLAGGWHCQFLEPDLKTSLPRKFIFQTSEKVEELIRRGGGMKDLAAKQAVEQAINKGRGGVFLSLTVEQYARLKG